MAGTIRGRINWHKAPVLRHNCPATHSTSEKEIYPRGYRKRLKKIAMQREDDMFPILPVHNKGPWHLEGIANVDEHETEIQQVAPSSNNPWVIATKASSKLVGDDKVLGVQLPGAVVSWSRKLACGELHRG